jgi:gamma-glutamyltranspeptidase / glutathione hydrolase
LKPAEIKFLSRRSPVITSGGMVAASQPLAVAAGLQLLSKGGNAADAAVALAAALNVTEPTSTGLGGDCFALYYSAASGEVSALNGSGRLPAELDIPRLRREGLVDELPARHPYTITVPGACAGWCDLLERFGSRSLKDILLPAIHLAEAGFPVSPITSHFWQKGAEDVLAAAPGGSQLTLEGRAPRPGEIFHNPGLARTLQRIAEGGKAAFYQGEIAQAIVEVVQKAGGCLTSEDLAGHTSTWDQPIWTDYHGVRLWECPPNGQGLVALLALNLLEGFDLAHRPALSAIRLHLQIEALRLAFADARRYVSDPAFSTVPLPELLSKEYASERRMLIDVQRANLHQNPGLFNTYATWTDGGKDTVYFAVVDRWGNACSFINSNYMGFGTGIVPQGWGFSLQNRGYGFSLEAGHPNALAPGKRPYHTIIPALLTKPAGKWGTKEETQELLACFGVMGGFMQPQGHVQVALGLIDDLLDPQAALDRPRFCLDEGAPDGKVLIEEGISENTIAALLRMGQPVSRVRGHDRVVFGRGQVILREARTGILWGGSDPRADGCAMTHM